MKKQTFAIIFLAVTILLLSGCSRRAMGNPPAVPSEPQSSQAAELPPEPVPLPSQPNQTDPTAMLTKEEAEAIALEYAGFTPDQVSRLRTEYEIDDRIPQYDVQFHEGRWEYEFEIHAETGDILSFEKDD